MSLLRALVATIFAVLMVSAGYAFSQPVSADGPVIVFDYNGHNRGNGGIQFTLSLFANGDVVFDGRSLTRVFGFAQSRVDADRVNKWVDALVGTGALAMKESSGYQPPPDSNWIRLTVAADAMSNSFRFHGWNGKVPLIGVLQEILDETEVMQKWVRYQKD
jgi:hypothetical protein